MSEFKHYKSCEGNGFCDCRVKWIKRLQRKAERRRRDDEFTKSN